MTPLISVILPTHNPHEGRLVRTLEALRAQTLPASQWELLVIDNASTRPPSAAFMTRHAPANFRVLREPDIGLTKARRCGFLAAAAPIATMEDDDNVLAPDYLQQALSLTATHPHVGTFGGRVIPEFESPPPAWTHEFHGLLALRDLGPEPQISQGLRPPGSTHKTYPLFAPFGAGMVLRREAWALWLASLEADGHAPTDRRGGDLSSGGDNDIVLTALAGGWEAAYFPALVLHHLIPASRLEPGYLGRLNRAIQHSWVCVLARHQACPWSPVARWTVPLRQARAWWRARAWRGKPERIRWHGLAGRLSGQGDLTRCHHPNP